jgi:hypothetical protein
MDPEVHDLHIQAGLKCGEDKTCGKKTKFETEEAASKAALAHNRWEKRKHDVEPYPCAFCHKWHVGGIMSLDVLRKIVNV